MNFIVLSSSALSSLKKLEFKHMVECVDDVVEVEQLEIDQMDEVEEVEQENLSSFSVAAGISAQVPMGILPHIYLNGYFWKAPDFYCYSQFHFEESML